MDHMNEVLIVVGLGFFGLKLWRKQKMKTKLPEMLGRGGVIIDVRSSQEFLGGANPRSVNIPLDRLNEASLKSYSKETPLILCCASGMRSGVALNQVRNLGFKEVVNAGSWMNTIL
jgi:rhodanese-related sulfurtransferase